MNTTLAVLVPRDRRLAVTAAVALAIACIGASGRAAAGETTRASKPESVGVGSGFVVGAAAGGPIGALVGAAAGGWFGDRLHRERSVHARTATELAAAERRADGLTMHLMFRTDEATPRAEDEPLLRQFAALATTTPGATVQVTGFADPRGAPRHNATLAAARAGEVAARLVAAGVPARQLVVSSETSAGPQPTATPGTAPEDGPPVAAPADLDGYAFQRRVTLRIVGIEAGEVSLAQRR